MHSGRVNCQNVYAGGVNANAYFYLRARRYFIVILLAVCYNEWDEEVCNSGKCIFAAAKLAQSVAKAAAGVCR